jgi:hypothetical protein
MSCDVEADLEPLLREVIRRGWMLVCCGPRNQPDALVAVNRRQSWTDVVVLRGHDRAVAYRTPTRPRDDPLQAFEVVWHYLSDAQRTLRAVLDIPPYAVAPAPYPIPQECRIPEAQRRPLIIRLGH